MYKRQVLIPSTEKTTGSLVNPLRTAPTRVSARNYLKFELPHFCSGKIVKEEITAVYNISSLSGNTDRNERFDIPMDTQTVVTFRANRVRTVWFLIFNVKYRNGDNITGHKVAYQTGGFMLARGANAIPT